MNLRHAIVTTCMAALLGPLSAVAPLHAAPPDQAAAAIDLPTVLSPDDQTRYRRILDIQERADWRTADTLIGRLTDPVLVGHLLAQRLLHPQYRASYKDLHDWLESYADHPDARQIHELALKRRAKGGPAPRPPAGTALQGSGFIPTDVRTPSLPRKAQSPSQAREAAALLTRVRGDLRRGNTLAAKRAIQSPEFTRLLSAAEQDSLRAGLGNNYFVDGEDDWALEWAGAAAERSGNLLMEAHWTAGLAAWRLGRFARAADYFEAVAVHDYSSSWMISAGAFWAARARLMDRDPSAFNRWLEIAAEYPRTFYGLLARHVLGLPMPFQWEPPPLDAEALERLKARPGGRRALALIQIDEIDLAERELRALASDADDEGLRGLLAVAARAGMAGLSSRLDGLLSKRGEAYDGAAFPIPRWRPDGGFKVDRALVFALIRQESGFNPNAQSPAGARGLMQIMPGTASFVARDSGYRRSKRSDLHDPDLNLQLGQRYIEILLGEDAIGGDLFLLAAAWNGGPGNLRKWLKGNKGADDPLMFIESIPLRETRIFVERVLANYWIYSHRFGQEVPSLDAVAAGEWPTYMPLDPESQMVARNVPN